MSNYCIRTQYSEHPRFFTEPGERIKKTYTLKINAAGQDVLELSGSIDSYSMIQSYKDSTDIDIIFRRYTNGETEALSKVQGFYADLTKYPKNLAEAYNQISEAEKAFGSLPAGVRSEFGNSLFNMLGAVSDDDFSERINKHLKRPVNTADSSTDGGSSDGE